MATFPARLRVTVAQRVCGRWWPLRDCCVAAAQTDLLGIWVNGNTTRAGLRARVSRRDNNTVSFAGILAQGEGSLMPVGRVALLNAATTQGQDCSSLNAAVAAGGSARGPKDGGAPPPPAD